MPFRIATCITFAVYLMDIGMALRAEFSLISSEFDAFLFAPIGEERNGMPLSVVSVAADLDNRLSPHRDVDPPARPARQRVDDRNRSSRTRGVDATAGERRRRECCVADNPVDPNRPAEGNRAGRPSGAHQGTMQE